MANDKILELRHHLHQHPELSNHEVKTSTRIVNFMETVQPDEIIALGKTGKAFVFLGKEDGKTLMYRAEMDALPITEETFLSYKSVNFGTAHACGHDGHMAIVSGLAQKISRNRPHKGKVVLLFQPAEEVEQGARDIVESPKFKLIEPDYAFALHNVPGIERNKILLTKDVFSAASKGMTVKLFGKTSHAAEPENGINPANAISIIIKQLNEMVNNQSLFTDLSILTIIHIRLGEIAFGTSPGYAEIRMTLRAFKDCDMVLLTRKAENIIQKVALAEKLKVEFEYNEIFPATVNDSDCVNLVKQSTIEAQLKYEYLTKPFRWSEDFAYFTQKYKACMFGLGAGKDHPQLHNPDYDFPDEIIQSGINVFYNIYLKINH